MIRVRSRNDLILAERLEAWDLATTQQAAQWGGETTYALNEVGFDGDVHAFARQPHIGELTLFTGLLNKFGDVLVVGVFYPTVREKLNFHSIYDANGILKQIYTRFKPAKSFT